MTEEIKMQTLINAQAKAHQAMLPYMKRQYYFCDENWDTELVYIRNAYMYRVWAKLYEEVSRNCSQLSSGHLKEEDVIVRLREENLPLYYEHKAPVTSEGLDDILTMYYESLKTSESAAKKIIEDYYKDKVTYEMLLITCRERLEKLLTENDVIFEIDIATFIPNAFLAHVTFKDDISIGIDYPTTLDTIVEDTELTIIALKEERALYQESVPEP